MKIPILNLYYLLCYAWNKLDEKNIVNVDSKNCTNLISLLALVLINGTKYLLRRGLDRNYIVNTQILSGVKGKLQLDSTIKENLLNSMQTKCSYDEFDYNVLHNKIIYTTLKKLLKVDNLDNNLKSKIRSLVIRLPKIDEMVITKRKFNQVKLNRNNYYYDFLLKVCLLIFENLLPNENEGNYNFKDFDRNEKKMGILFESFVRNFYKKEQSKFKIKRSNIKWDLNSETDFEQKYIPLMQTDITLQSNNNKIIIDTKYYKDVFSNNYNTEKIHSNNLYQLFAYLINQEEKTLITKVCKGILLYPTNGENINLNYKYRKHKIQISTINLNQNWHLIEDDLLELIGIAND